MSVVRAAISRRVWVPAVFWFQLVVLVTFAPSAAAVDPPEITQVRLNNGATETLTDTVLVTYWFTHPAAPSTAVPFFRSRSKSPDDGSWPEWGGWIPNTRGTNDFTHILKNRSVSAPIPGPHRIEVQLRDNLGGESNVWAETIVRVPPATPPPTMTLRVERDAPLVPAFADQHGFKFEAVNLNPRTTDCIVELEPEFVFTARPKSPVAPTPSVPPPGPCRLRMFMYGQLQPGWSLKSVTLAEAGDHVAVFVSDPPVGSGPDASLTIELRSSNTASGVQPQVSVTLAEIVLEGPRRGGHGWREAFRPLPAF